MVCKFILKSFVGLCTMLHFHCYDMLLFTSLLLWSCLVISFMTFMKIYFPLILSCISWIMFTFLLFDEVKKGEKGMCFVENFRIWRSHGLQKKGGDILFHGWIKFSKRFCHHQKRGDWRSVFHLDTVAGLFWWLQSPAEKEERNWRWRS